MFCGHCGANNPDGARFCGGCGRPPAGAAAPPPQYPPPPPQVQQPAPPPPYAQPGYAPPPGYGAPPPGYGPPQQGWPAPPNQGPPPQVPTHLGLAIVSTLLCCLPIGIFAIVKASQVSSKLAAGDIAGAQEASRAAKRYAIMGMVLGLVGTVIYVVAVANRLGMQ